MEEPRRHRDGEEAYADAVERLEAARTSQGDLDDRAEAAEGTADEDEAADAKAAGRNQIAAREAWVAGAEREGECGRWVTRWPTTSSERWSPDSRGAIAAAARSSSAPRSW